MPTTLPPNNEGNKKFRKFMGGVAAVISTPIAVASGLVAATARSIEKGSFDEFESRFDEVGAKVMETAQEIGEQHGPELLVTVTAIVVGGKINDMGHKK